MASQKTIIDPVHGNVQLNELEADIVSSPTFQRLHNVRQLGLAHLVFPSANYSRFAHSIGACHNAQRIVDAIRRNGNSGLISDRDANVCRLAALLHDIGHYPFSHATEHVVKDEYSKTLLSPEDSTSSVTKAEQADLEEAEETAPYLDHELVGRKLIEHDPHLKAVFQKHGQSIEELKHVFSKERPSPLVGVISSDLDCDRLDYLRRTAHTSGLPYGMVDIDYIIDQSNLDKDGKYCFGRKALRAADHLLVSRYYDYLQVPFHKMVVALEWSLVTCMKQLITLGKLDLSPKSVLHKIQNGDWVELDDSAMLSSFREIRKSLPSKGSPISAHLDAVLHRKAAKMIGGIEVVEPRNNHSHHANKVAIQSIVSKVSNELDIAQEYFHVWDHKLKITKAYSKGDETAEAEGTVFILGSDQLSKPITMFPQALMKTLGGYEYTGIRIYVLDHEERLNTIRAAFAKHAKQDIPDLALEFSPQQ